MIAKKPKGTGLYNSPSFTNIKTYLHRQIINGKKTTLQHIGRVFRITCKEAEKICKSEKGISIELNPCHHKSIVDLDIDFDDFDDTEFVDE